ncbi:MAG: Gfo/Idh/MocA family oxidoreductase [Verrucomicrobia bacterium]|nr:Gfo/Idh/MocA family oxidoreductase [Verrucomicrobiota bacterium]
MKTNANNPAPEISRRNFLKTSAAAASGPLVAGLAIERAAFAAGDDTVKLALIGCGDRGAGAVSQALRTKGLVKLWAMADLFADRIEAKLGILSKGEKGAYDRESHQGFSAQIEVPPERRFVGFDAYQEAMDSGVDAVILTTPPHFRAAHFQYAVQHGKHVFMEKPLAVDAPGIRQILAANDEAKKKNLKVAVGFHNRHSPRIQETIRRLRDGAIGPINLMRAYWNVGLLRDTPPRPPEMSEMLYQLRNPYHFLWLSGDYFVDALIHYIDLCCWLKGTHPATVQGQGGRQMLSPTQSGDTFDHHFVEFAFEDESRMFAQTRQIPTCWNRGGTHAHGGAGHADIVQGRIEGSTPWRFSGPPTNPYQAELDTLMEAIRRDQPRNDVEFAATSTMTAIMGRMASYSGQMVRWEDALNSKVRLAPEKYAFDAKPPVVADKNGIYPIAVPGVSKVV